MELKWRCCTDGMKQSWFELNLYGIEIGKGKGLQLSRLVWIEPLWNWNLRETAARSRTVEVWIEPLWNWNRLTTLIITDRWKVWIEPLWNWNKVSKLTAKKNIAVWIEPLWNWNRRAAASPAMPKRLNWTFMELKYWRCLKSMSPKRGLNWTFMELKLVTRYLRVYASICLNWTFMELKWRYRGGWGNAYSEFELNLYGIEI